MREILKQFEHSQGNRALDNFGQGRILRSIGRQKHVKANTARTAVSTRRQRVDDLFDVSKGCKLEGEKLFDHAGKPREAQRRFSKQRNNTAAARSGTLQVCAVPISSGGRDRRRGRLRFQARNRLR